MLQALFKFFGLLCISGCVSAEQYTLSDELSLIQEITRIPTERRSGFDEIMSRIQKNIERLDIVKKTKRISDCADKPGALIQGANSTTNLQVILAAMHTSLETTVCSLAVLNNGTYDALDAFVQAVYDTRDINNFVMPALSALDAFNQLLPPAISALDTSGEAVLQVLIKTGYKHLGRNFDQTFTKGIKPMKTTLVTIEQVKSILDDIDVKMKKSGGSITAGVKKDLKRITDKFETFEKVNTTFNREIIKAYQTVVGYFDKTTNDVAMQSSLDNVMPQVIQMVESVWFPVMGVKVAFYDTVNVLSEPVQANAHRTAHLSLLALTRSGSHSVGVPHIIQGLGDVQ